MTIRGAARGPGTPANPPAPTAATPPPFHLLVGESARLSGALGALTRSEVRWAPGWQRGEITLPRRCVQAIVQRPGEAQVLADRFDAIDPARWSITGKPATAEQPGRGEGRSLRLPAEGASLTHNLEESLAAGRLELAFHDDGAVSRGRKCVLEPVFRGPMGPAVMRIILGWSEESLSVQTTPRGPSLQVQHLARTPGWHRVVLRFGPGETEISVDGQELAHGREPEGPLCAIRLATRITDAAAAARPTSASFDDLRLIRFAEPPASLEIDATQDEARLVVGDQIFGDVRGADAERVVIAVDGRPIALRWGEVAGLYLRRVPVQGFPVEGLLVRAEWPSATGQRPADLDFVEGALLAQSDDSFTIATPFAGMLTLPRRAIRRLAVVGKGRRIVLDVSAHHLGDEISVSQPLNPPQPEGLTLERTIELAAVPDDPAELVLDVKGVVAEAGDSQYSTQVRNGELRSFVAVNGQRVNYLNRHIKSADESLERIRIAIPRRLLHPGKNVFRIELTGDSDPQPKYDDLGILQIAVEFPGAGVGTAVPAAAPAARPAQPGPS